MSKEPTRAAHPVAIDARRLQITRSWISQLRSGSLIELRKGGPRSLFLIHDGAGEILPYLSLARRMPPDLAVFGIEPHGIRGVPLAHATIEDMAAFYLEEMRQKQPHGPYQLGGLCAGGVIAYEMASQLIRAGESVELVALLETAAPNAPERPGRIRQQRFERLKQSIAHAQMKELNPLSRAGATIREISPTLLNWLLSGISHRAEKLSVRVRFRLLREVLSRGTAWPKRVRELSVPQIYEVAQARYAPKPLSLSSVVLVRALSGAGDDTPYRDIYSDETFGWHSLVRGLAVLDVAGGHLTMLHEQFVDSLAKALLPYLQHWSGPQERPGPWREG
jgi:thioesterase domain-containing protein